MAFLVKTRMIIFCNFKQISHERKTDQMMVAIKLEFQSIKVLGIDKEIISIKGAFILTLNDILQVGWSSSLVCSVCGCYHFGFILSVDEPKSRVFSYDIGSLKEVLPECYLNYVYNSNDVLGCQRQKVFCGIFKMLFWWYVFQGVLIMSFWVFNLEVGSLFFHGFTNM